MQRRSFYLAFALVASAASVANAAPTARFVATPLQGTTCVAPCAVHFDAIGTGSSLTVDPAVARPFHSLIFEWDFGDPASGGWPYGGGARNRAVGAIAGHLFETPGSYAVRLAVTNPSGQTHVATTTVVVANPDTAIAAANTWCFANSGTPGGAGFEACPVRAAAQHRLISASATGGFNSALATCGVSSRKARCLFRTGDTFRASGMASLGSQAGAGLVASFGSGARPRVVGGSGFVSLGDGWTVAHFDVDVAGSEPLFRLAPERSGATVVDVRGRNLRGACFETQTGGGRFHNDRVGLFGLDCLLRTGSTITSVYLRSNRTLVLGNSIDNGYAGEFNLRSVHLARSVIAYNRFARPQEDANNQRNSIQLRAWAANQFGGGTYPPVAKTEFVIVADNHISQDNSGVFIRTCQTNDCTDGPRAQAVENLVLERNFVSFSTGGTGGRSRVRALWMQGGDITIRNNVFDFQGLAPATSYATDSLFDHQSNMAQAPGLNDDRIHVLNNTVYYDDAVSSGFMFCRGGGVGAAHQCRGNLAWLPGQTGARQISDGGAWTASQNLYAGPNPFVGAVPQQGASAITSFQLQPSGPAADASYDFGSGDPSVRLDAVNRCRPADGADVDAIAHWDNGAFEANSTLACRRIP